MKLTKDVARVNVYNVTEVDDVLEKVTKYIETTKTIDIEENSLTELILNMIAFEIVNKLEGKLKDSNDAAMSAPILKIEGELLKRYSYVLTQDLYITLTTIDETKNLYGYAVL